jgi:putative transposase
MIEPAHPQLSVTQQCELLGLPRSSFYYQPEPMPEEDTRLMRCIDELYLAYPFYGSRQMTRALRREGHTINRKRVQRLMRLMGLEAIYQKPNLSRPNLAHKIYPYLLRHLAVMRPNQVWATDITYVPIRGGCIYLCAVIDWFSRRVLAWELSNTLDATFCVRAVERAIAAHGVPEIFNTDQGCQFTSREFTQPLLDLGVKLSMDGKGRALDNVFVERLWRSVKYEEIHLRGYVSGVDAYAHLERYFDFYNHRRPHSSLDDRTPDEAYRDPLPPAVNQ